MAPLWAKIAILMAAMPTGAGSFLLAGGAGRWAMEVSSATIVMTTVAAAATLAAVLFLVGV